jgi:hypothetical protein
VVLEVELPRPDSIEIFRSYWQSRIVSGLVPTLPDFLDQFEPTVAPWTMITDIEPNTMPIRFFGTGMVSLIGTDMSGQDYDAVLPAQARGERFARAHSAVTHPCGLHTAIQVATKGGLTYELHAIALPLLRRAGGRCLAKFTCPVRSDHLTHAEGSRVLSLERVSWLDIGAGVPSDNFAEKRDPLFGAMR